jgi:hypothetical protein
MTKKYIAIFSFALILCLALGFGVIKKGTTGDPTATAPTNSDNIVYAVHGNTNSSIDAIWSESFDGLALPSGWLNIQESGTGLYTFVGTGTYPTCSPHSGAGMAEYNSFNINASTAASLVSSSFSLTSGPSKLGFWMFRDSLYPTLTDKVDFMINTSPTSSGATLLGTINRAKTLAPIETGINNWYYYEFTIPTSFNTATNYLVMKATSQYGSNIFLDDISVSNLLTTDVGTFTIDVPDLQNPGTIVPKATVKNYGSTTQTFPVTMTITPGGYTNTQNVTSLASGASLQVTFGNWTAGNGTYTVKVYTQLTGDLDHSNDTLRKVVTLSTSGWSTGAVCPSPASLGAGVGYSRHDSGWVFSIAGQSNLTAVTKYNVRANTWTTVAPLPIGLDRFGACVLKDSIYVVGGATGSSTYGAQVYKYDINANTWVTRASVPAALGWNKVVGYQDSLIYSAGGIVSGATTSQVLLYNAKTDSWRTATSLPTAIMGGAFSRVGDTLVYAGGSTDAAVQSTTYVGIISQTNRSVITWSTGASIPGGIVYRLDADRWGCKGIILAGGSNVWAWTDFQNKAYVYTPSTNTYTQLPNMATGLTAPHLGSVNLGLNHWKFLVVGGYNGSTYGTPLIFSDSLDCIINGVGNNVNAVPTEYALSQNYPNPFNPVTRISYALPKAGFVTLKIYDIMGREVRTLVNEYKTANNYSVEFNASELSSGVYFYRINVNGFSEMRKMMLIK